MLISDISTSYLSEFFYLHILAFRPNSDRSWDIVATDYTRHERLEDTSYGDQNKLGLNKNQRIRIKILPELFTKLSSEYKLKSKKDLFDGSDVNLKVSSWVEVSTGFCFAKLHIRFHKSLEGYAIGGAIVKEQSEEFDSFWSRFSYFVGDKVSSIPSILINSVENCVKESALDNLCGRMDNQLDFFSFDKLPAIKLEKLERDEKPAAFPNQALDQSSLLRLTLEPVSESNRARGFQATSQLATSKEKSYPTEVEFASAYAPEEFLTQMSTQPRAIDRQNNITKSISTENSQVRRVHSSADMDLRLDTNQTISLTNFLNKTSEQLMYKATKIHRVKAQIICYTPNFLTQLCTKLYLQEDSEILTTGPRLNSLKFMIADCEPGLLTPKNSLIVSVPQSCILKFFSCKHMEQLYTSLREKEFKLKQILNRTIYAEIILEKEFETETWVLKNTTLENLLG